MDLISDEVNVNNIIDSNFNKNKCWARLAKDTSKQCSCKAKNNFNFCGRHIKKANSGNIKTIFDIVTIYKSKKKKIIIQKKKKFIRIDYCVELPFIIKIQSFFRKLIVKININRKGVAIYNRHLCNNKTDCLSFDKIEDIDLNEFFSYKDCNKLYWGFKTNTFKEIIKRDINNPYSTLEIPDKIKQKFNILLLEIEKYKKVVIPKENIINKDVKLQQKCIDIFQKMDNLKNYTKCEWFLTLNIAQLKELYKQMEDLWSYRLNLNNVQKLKYITDGKLFTLSVSKFNKLNNRYTIANIILDEFNRLITEGQQEADRATGCQWILSGLTLVNLDARNSLPWLFQSACIY
jgi:hypothetical protein